MSADEPTQGQIPSAVPTPPNVWDRICAWLVLLGALFPVASVVLIVAVQPRLFWAAVVSRAVPWWSLLLPVLLCTGAVLLVRMRRRSFPVLASHLALAFIYAVSRRGSEALSPVAMLGFGLEGLAVVFRSYLFRTKKLQ